MFIQHGTYWIPDRRVHIQGKPNKSHKSSLFPSVYNLRVTDEQNNVSDGIAMPKSHLLLFLNIGLRSPGLIAIYPEENLHSELIDYMMEEQRVTF